MSEVITEETRKIVESGVLGRSRTYARLLEYLAQCSTEGRQPREIEIAADVFGRGREYDPLQDSHVRVYVHNLRRKLDKYYAAESTGEGWRLTVPRGEYRLAVVPTDEAVKEAAVRRTPPVWLALVAGLLVVNLIVVIAFREGAPPSGEWPELARSRTWAELLDDDLPILVVVGDYYIFAELDPLGNVTRLVREFDVNSGDDLDDLFVRDPALLASYMDLDLTYLPQGSAFALADLLRVVYTSDKPVRVTPMSEMRVADLKSHHILYVGYISSLGILMDFVFASSGLRVGESFDELFNMQTGEYYTSDAGIPGESDYEDYGLVSAFPGPDGNQFLIVAGTRDSGLMHTAQAITALADVSALEREWESESAAGPPAFEALYEVTGFDRMNLDATLVYTSSLDYRRIWGGEVAGP